MKTAVNVSGMACKRCVTSVSEEIKELYGVEGVHITLNSGGVSQLTITSNQVPDSAAIGEAGYLLIPNSA